MLRYILHRSGYSLLILFGVVTVVFFLFHVMPADPARLVMGQRSDLASIENARREMNLDKPLAQRYFLFLNDLSPVSWHKKTDQEKYHFIRLFATGKDHVIALKRPYLGRSYHSRRIVTEVLGEALPGTIILAVSAMVLATVLGIFLGMVAAIRKDTWADFSAVAGSVAGISVPSFFAGLVIAYVFGYLLHSYTGLDMTGSLYEYDPFTGRKLAIKNLILPAIALGIRPLAIITQLTRSALLDALSQDYIRTAYAKGLGKWRIVWKHALPNAINPVLTAVSGWFAELLAGSFFIEYIFNWKGVGKITVAALDKFDFPLVMGSVLLTSVIFITINFITDILYGLTDPRVRLQ